MSGQVSRGSAGEPAHLPDTRAAQQASIRQMSSKVWRGSAASIRQMSRQVSRGSAGEYQADERAALKKSDESSKLLNSLDTCIFCLVKFIYFIQYPFFFALEPVQYH